MPSSDRAAFETLEKILLESYEALVAAGGPDEPPPKKVAQWMAKSLEERGALDKVDEWRAKSGDMDPNDR